MATSILARSILFEPESWFCIALREWHAEQPTCGVEPTVPEWRFVNDPKLGDYCVPTHAAWYCDCGTPRYGGIAPGRPTPHLVLLFESHLRERGARALAAAFGQRSSE